MKEVILHVRDTDVFFADAEEMARRLDRGQTKSAPARFAFESMEGLLKVLTANRWALLRALRHLGPASVRALSKHLARDYRGVHADVALLVEAGLIARDSDGLIYVPWSRIAAEMALDAAA
ncbi:DNA-binding protein [Methylocapsa sp. S129]|uniref:HVO_A0114 family putative DNA-binding protein n=1 Tax=Methylocapsa sp. S129 TaxID=1641869 RepID=UPI00131B4123|nr:DNA-binding protein [Methylocapsa sp. S129]